jgi:hypothetical protein
MGECDDPSHYPREKCPYCGGSGRAEWLKQHSEIDAAILAWQNEGGKFSAVDIEKFILLLIASRRAPESGQAQTGSTAAESLNHDAKVSMDGMMAFAGALTKPLYADPLFGQIARNIIGPAIPRDLLAKIIDEVFDGAIEDTSPIEDIYRVVMRESKPAEGQEPVAEQLGRCCYGGFKKKTDCASCSAWQPQRPSEHDAKDLAELRPFYTREGAEALIRKHWPDMLAQRPAVPEADIKYLASRMLNTENRFGQSMHYKITQDELIKFVHALTAAPAPERPTKFVASETWFHSAAHIVLVYDRAKAANNEFGQKAAFASAIGLLREAIGGIEEHPNGQG